MRVEDCLFNLPSSFQEETNEAQRGQSLLAAISGRNKDTVFSEPGLCIL